jgi:hypothetical protein
MTIDNWRAALECDRLSGLKALQDFFGETLSAPKLHSTQLHIISYFKI